MKLIREWKDLLDRAFTQDPCLLLGKTSPADTLRFLCIWQSYSIYIQRSQLCTYNMQLL